jgi:hypothetical protein
MRCQYCGRLRSDVASGAKVDPQREDWWAGCSGACPMRTAPDAGDVQPLLVRLAGLLTSVGLSAGAPPLLDPRREGR